MTAQTLDGKALAQTVRHELTQTIAKHLASGGVKPGLAVLLVGDDPASQVYVRNKVKACAEVGMASTLLHLPADTTQHALLQHIEQLNQDPLVHGVLVQLPLPPQLDEALVMAAIDPTKDVDGFHVANAGALLLGQPGFWPCTPHGCMRMLDSIDGMQSLRGKHAVVVGRSHIVGKPLALMLLARDATVTICHSGTPNLAAQTRQADVLVAAVGRAGLITQDMVQPGAVVLDVGINRNAQGKLCGDVAPEVAQVAGYLSPVPGGVGPMTIAMLLHNTVQAALNRA
ncbi:MAG: bifunctional methylenetetrahydrofolate dehydrogenase/methenyltetrahydrofolate cyclohydrolase FolD [Betaproteobacteria bacterium]|jgi:methylenetetrahydrofolate dehydrogenase (NADP+)/methenyltetrahydrofolate cyclohydrolase|nr:bifunctional methylenetetrahydrofolate dehydrogenase/methenyltetrahydrofolate cyclohydrolase FolD [Candidatus Fonsibacter lacus]